MRALRRFAAAGAKVLIATRTAKNGQAVADSIVGSGGAASLLQTDVGQHEQVIKHDAVALAQMAAVIGLERTLCRRQRRALRVIDEIEFKP